MRSRSNNIHNKTKKPPNGGGRLLQPQERQVCDATTILRITDAELVLEPPRQEKRAVEVHVPCMADRSHAQLMHSYNECCCRDPLTLRVVERRESRRRGSAFPAATTIRRVTTKRPQKERPVCKSTLMLFFHLCVANSLQPSWE